MKNYYLLCAILLALSFSTSCKKNTPANEDIKLVTAQEMQSILDLEDAQLIDVRTPIEYNEIRIAKAQNIDYASPSFNEDIEKLDKNKPVILYCKGGNRSAKCAKKLKDAGFEKIYDLEGGITKWKHSDKIKIEIKS